MCSHSKGHFQGQKGQIRVFTLIYLKRWMLWPKFIWNTYSKSYSTNHVYLHRPNAFGFWQMRLHLCYEMRLAWTETAHFAFASFRKFDLWSVSVWWVYFHSKLMFPKPLVKSIWAIMCDVTGHSHWIDNVRCKMHQTRLQVKRTSRLRLKRLKIKCV